MVATERFRGDEPEIEGDNLVGPWGAELDAELDVEDAFGAHDIEYWVRRENRLVPATAEDIERIRAWESQRVALLLVERWEREQPHPLGRWLARCRGWLRRATRRLAETRIPKAAQSKPKQI